MLFKILLANFLLGMASAECNTGAPAGLDLCSKIPILGKGGWSVNWPLVLLKNISGKTTGGSPIRLDDIAVTKVWIADCSLTGTKDNLTAAVESAGVELRASSSGTQVQAKLELGNCMAQALRCLKPKPSHSGKLHGKAHVEGDTLATTLELALLPKVMWTPVNQDETAAVVSSTPIDNLLFQLVHPVIEATLNMQRSAAATFDWCSALSPIMDKSVQCTSAKVCNLEALTKKAMSLFGMGGLPYKLPIGNWVVASASAYADNPRITEIITPSCSAKTSLPLAADVIAKGLQVVIQIDIRVHVCALWIICHDLHPTTFATMTLPGNFNATVTQPEGLASLRVSQAFTEYAVDAKWDEFMLGTTLGNSTDDLSQCMKTLTKTNATACDDLIVEASQQSLALELGQGELGTGMRSAIVEFTGLKMDGAALPSMQASFAVSSAEGKEIMI